MEQKNSSVGQWFLLLVVIMLLGFVVFTQFSVLPAEQKVSALKLLVDDKDSVSVEVQPIKLSHTENSEFSVAFNTHSVALDFDPAKVSVLQDNAGKKYLPIKWDGSPSGGHHRSGKLIFSKLSDSAMEVKLTIKVLKSDRVFEWSLH